MEACQDEQDLRVAGRCGDGNSALFPRTRGEAEGEVETTAGETAQRKPGGQAIQTATEYERERLERVDAVVQDHLLFERRPLWCRYEWCGVLAARTEDEGGAWGAEPCAHGTR